MSNTNGAGSFLQGMAGGIGLGMQAQKMGGMKNTSQLQAPSGTQAVQATAQNGADAASGGMGLTLPGQPATQQTAQPQAGGGLLSQIQSLIQGIGGAGNG